MYYSMLGDFDKDGIRVDAKRMYATNKCLASKKTGVLSTVGSRHMIKLALDTIDLVILRWQVDEAMSNKPVDRQEYYRLTRARELLAECNTTVVLQ